MWRDDDEGAGYAVRTGVDGRLTGGFNLYKRVHHEAPRFPPSCGYNVCYDNWDAIANSETIWQEYHRGDLQEAREVADRTRQAFGGDLLL